MKKYLWLIYLIIANMATAQDFNREKLDEYFNLLSKHKKFMGSVAVSKDGKIIYQKAAGFCDYENNLKATPESRYRIGSISKTFTSVLVLKAIEEKKLEIDHTIDKYFPNLENAGQITVYHLLNHKSGIRSFTDDKNYLTWNTQSHTKDEMVEIIEKSGIEFNPGEESKYSNSNFVLLTFILEDLYSKPYKSLVEQYITEPLQLKNTYLGGHINTADNECRSYNFLKDWSAESETDISIPLGAGGIVSTPSDLVTFSDALFGGRLLTQESLEKMKTIDGNFGLGLFQIPFYERIGYGHTGGIDAFSAVFAHFPEDNVSYAMTSNGTVVDNNDISIAVLSAVFGKPYELPVFDGYNVSEDALEKYLGTYVSKQIPLKITVFKEGNVLLAQATGQTSFSLEATEEHKFRFQKAGIVMEFNPDEKSMILKQGGGVFLYIME